MTKSAPSASDQRLVRLWLARLATENRRWINATIVAGLTAALATIMQMFFLARIVHLGIVNGVQSAQLLPLFSGLLLAIAIRSIAQGFQARFASRCSEKVRQDVRQQINHHWQSVGPVAIGLSSAGELAREWIDHVEALHGYFARFKPQLALSVIIPLVILALVFTLDWLAGLLLLFSAPLIPLFMALIGMGAEKLNQQHFNIISQLSGQFLDKVRGLTTLQLFGQTEWATELIQNRSDRYRIITMKTLRVAFLSSAVLEFFASAAIAMIAIYIGFGLLGSITYGPSEDLSLFSGLFILLLAPEFFQPLRTLSQHYHDRASALGAGAELLLRLNTSATTSNQSATEPDNRDSDTASGIHLRNATHAYQQGQPVLQGVNLTVQRGECVALTGPSGGGKTTLLHLLAGFIRPDVGTVSIFGQPAGSFSFGWLGQKGFLVSGSWADNLRLVAPEATDIAIVTALRSAGLGPLLDTREDGIYSRISEDGKGISGGQARRLSLARIFVADYDLILLDEPTAGLDRDSEMHVLKGLGALAQAGKTLIFSTHHEALLSLADRVLLVADGEVHDA
ncbi:MAG TPA: thiol reductant ABC exporter subunit CydD [Marinobacter sp.]|nr:thiol reductant ABC exporter subunit CydD [Marinobacter sp.]